MAARAIRPSLMPPLASVVNEAVDFAVGLMKQPLLQHL
jgi:hypothetical protein